MIQIGVNYINSENQVLIVCQCQFIKTKISKKNQACFQFYDKTQIMCEYTIFDMGLKNLSCNMSAI